MENIDIYRLQILLIGVVSYDFKRMHFIDMEGAGLSVLERAVAGYRHSVCHVAGTG